MSVKNFQEITNIVVSLMQMMQKHPNAIACLGWFRELVLQIYLRFKQVAWGHPTTACVGFAATPRKLKAAAADVVLLFKGKFWKVTIRRRGK